MARRSPKLSPWTTALLLLSGCGPRELGSYGFSDHEMSPDPHTGKDAGHEPERDAATTPELDSGAPASEVDASPACPGGGVEVCDGVDNDCDGLVDLEDQLAGQRGENRQLADGERPAVAWSPGGQLYGVSYLLAGEVFFRTFDAAGMPRSAPATVSTNGQEESGAMSTAIAWGSDAFGVSWSRNGQLGFRRMSTEGWTLSQPVDVAPGWSQFGSSKIVRFGTGEWLVLFECCRSASVLYGRRIDAAGSMILDPVQTLHDGPAQLTGAAISGDQLGISWWRATTTQSAPSYFAEWTRLHGDLSRVEETDALLDTIEHPGKLEQPVLAPAADGYTVAWSRVQADATQHLMLAELDREGQVRCGPTDLSTSFPEGSLPFVPRDIVATEQGALLVGDGLASKESEQLYTLDLVETRRGCEPGRRLRLDTTKGQPLPALATAGDQGVAVVWQDYIANTSHVMQRVLDPAVCAASR